VPVAGRARAGRGGRRGALEPGDGHGRARLMGDALHPDDLLGSSVVDAAVEALINRNREHVERMVGDERDAAIAHWRSMVLDVLTAARAAVGGPDRREPRGRAVIVLEDNGGTDVDIHAAFHPE